MATDSAESVITQNKSWLTLDVWAVLLALLLALLVRVGVLQHIPW